MIARSADFRGADRNSVAGRHVLGSIPESLEPVNPASLPSLWASEEPGVGEPERTIHHDWWRDARRRAQLTDPTLRPLLNAALDHVEAGWLHMREVQRWHEENRERAHGRHDDYALVLHFIDGDLVDLFREIAAEVADLVPGYPGYETTADPGSLDGDIDTFRRYFALFTLAVEQAPGAEPLRGIARAAAAGLTGWCTELDAFVAAIDAECINP